MAIIIFLSIIAFTFSLVALGLAIGYREEAVALSDKLNNLDRIVRRDVQPLLEELETQVNIYDYAAMPTKPVKIKKAIPLRKTRKKD